MAATGSIGFKLKRRSTVQSASNRAARSQRPRPADEATRSDGQARVGQACTGPISPDSCEPFLGLRLRECALSGAEAGLEMSRAGFSVQSAKGPEGRRWQNLRTCRRREQSAKADRLRDRLRALSRSANGNIICQAIRPPQPSSKASRNQTTVICCRRADANRLFGIMAWTPRTMSTTWVTRKLAPMLSSP